uniref:Pleiotropic drug resistance protein 1-like n=1 Tax=Nicotiana sylvestris TaxID=4096 RepID=A0A1U7YR81_NICSY|nr:PREDICTED: pleiotropic drug resistance protein 1-like [Nicotiana sylvestris]
MEPENISDIRGSSLRGSLKLSVNSTKSIWRNNGVEIFSRSSRHEDDEEALKWAALEKLPTFDRLRKGLLFGSQGAAAEVDIHDLGFQERKNLLERLVKITNEDNEKFLLKFRQRIDRFNFFQRSRAPKRVITHVVPGPPGSGKTTLLIALAGKLDPALKVTGKVTYNGPEMNEFPQAMIPKDSEDAKTTNNEKEQSNSKKKGMVLPFEPHSITFDEVIYSVDMPQEMKNQGATEDRLVLLKGVSGAFRPGVLTALMGVSGAGKTTLMDVLAGRKTGGYIEGSIKISGYTKKQETFARISGYCEQNDIHSPHVTVHESLVYSAWLRLPHDVDERTRKMFVDEVMELVELTPLRSALVGLPGVNGLSTEQRKRLTIAVELVANPLLDHAQRKQVYNQASNTCKLDNAIITRL